MKKLFTILLVLCTSALFAQTTITIPLSAKVTKVAQNSTITSTVWSFDAGTGGTITNPNQLSTTAILPALPGTFKIRITVKDNMGNAPYKIKTIQIVDNRAPIIDAGPADTTIYLGSTSAVIEPKNGSYVSSGSSIIPYNASTFLRYNVSLPVGEIKDEE